MMIYSLLSSHFTYFLIVISISYFLHCIKAGFFIYACFRQSFFFTFKVMEMQRIVFGITNFMKQVVAEVNYINFESSQAEYGSRECLDQFIILARVSSNITRWPKHFVLNYFFGG